ncbi:MAG: hypothetical protein LBO82_03920 [Synergistaceae bacterium]|nr:hypothetical protein [Synergistaceae bacterium]
MRGAGFSAPLPSIFASISALFLAFSLAFSPALPFAAPEISAEAAEAVLLRFSEMYDGATPLGLSLSEKLKSLNGRVVAMEGFMAPPLKPTLSFFVLTRVPMSLCPFCSSDADWPYDIVLVCLEKPVIALPFDRPIRVEGVLELGTETDPETGFVSLVRIRATRLREA